MADQAVTAVDQAAHEAAVADARAAGMKEGATTERARIGAILGSEEAKGRESLAQHFAFKSDMDAEAAVAALSAAPKAEAPAPAAEQPAQTFEQAMANGNPDVGASTPGNGDEATDTAAQTRELAAKLGLKGFA